MRQMSLVKFKVPTLPILHSILFHALNISCINQNTIEITLRILGIQGR